MFLKNSNLHTKLILTFKIYTLYSYVHKTSKIVLTKHLY